MKACDILVVGGGLAAMKSAVTAAKSGLEVSWIVKKKVCGGASFYPMMDQVACQVSTGVPEEDALYMEEILDASQGMASQEMNQIYIDTIRQRVEEFPEIGVTDFHLTEPKVACFASRPRPTYVWRDWPQIRKNMRDIVEKTPNLNLMENTALLGILTEGGAVSGALVRTPEGLDTIPCKAMVLATGGMGDLFQYNLNTPDVSGDGQAVALLAGAQCINLEFNQFIPGFVSPAYKTVFRETTVPYMHALTDENERDLLKDILPDDEERAECLRLRGKHGPFTNRTLSRYFDIAMMKGILNKEGEVTGFGIRYDEEIAQDMSTYVHPYYLWLKERHKVDLAKDEVFIAPFWHAANGGVKIDKTCATSLPGLFACGEVSGGIHGADRHGGHSTGSCLVFGYIAGNSAAAYAKDQPQLPTENAQDAARRLFSQQGSLTPEALLPDIRRLMFRRGNVIRQEQVLKEGIAQLKTWQQDFGPFPYLEGKGWEGAVKARNFLMLGQALLTAMENRKESRGSHYREDYPDTREEYNRRFTIALQGEDIQVREEVK